MSIKEVSTLPAGPDRSSDIHPVAKRHEMTTDRPPEGDAFFEKRARECITLRDLELSEEMRNDLHRAKAVIDEIVMAIETCGLNAERRTIDPAIFLFPIPFVPNEEADPNGEMLIARSLNINYRVFGLDAANAFANNDDLLWALRALPYFPMESMADLDMPVEALQKNLLTRINLLKALAEMLYDLVYQLDRPKMDWQVNYLLAWQNIKTSNFVPVTKNGRPQELVVQDPAFPRGAGQRVVIDSFRIEPFRDSVLTYLAEKHREKGTQTRNSVRRISLAGIPVVSPSRQIASTSSNTRTGLEDLLEEYLSFDRRTGAGK